MAIRVDVKKKEKKRKKSGCDSMIFKPRPEDNLPKFKVALPPPKPIYALVSMPQR